MTKNELSVGDKVKVFVHDFNEAQTMIVTDLGSGVDCKVRLQRYGDASEWYVHTHQIVEVLQPVLNKRETRIADIADWALNHLQIRDGQMYIRDQARSYLEEIKSMRGC